jgi:chromosome segregation ATPase
LTEKLESLETNLQTESASLTELKEKCTNLETDLEKAKERETELNNSFDELSEVR